MGPKKRKPKENPGKKNEVLKHPRKEGNFSKQVNLSRAPLKNISLNIVKQFDSLQRNGLFGCNFQRSGENIVCQRLKHYSICHICNSSEKRITAISWHKSRVLFISGNKAGDLTLYTLNDKTLFTESHQWSGGGPGLSVLSIHFPDLFENKLLTAGIDGTVKLWDLETLKDVAERTLLSTGTIERWYCSVSSSVASGLTVAGDTKGFLHIMDKDLNVLYKEKIHGSKINTAEFNSCDSWLLATASGDKSVKLFDVRNFKSALHTMYHERAVNSAFFSQTNSHKLLTTDQNDEVRVYGGPNWDSLITINHPHRHYMYLTPIKAIWHPQCDLIVVGRYPDPKRCDYVKGELSTVDIFNDIGELKCQLFPSNCTGILSLNGFNHTGEFLASTIGVSIPIWRFQDSFVNPKVPVARRKDDVDNNDQDDNDNSPKPKKPRQNTNSKTVSTKKSVKSKKVS